MFESWRSAGAAREPADAVVAVLHRELLVPVDQEVANAHLEAMSLELAVSRASFADRDRGARRVPRTVVGSALVAGALTFMTGLGAAGALPPPAQHWLSGATRVFGIHLPDRPTHPSGRSGDGAGPVAVPAKAPTNAPADHAQGAATHLGSPAGSASSPSGVRPTDSSGAGPGSPSGAQSSELDSPGREDGAGAAEAPGSNAGGNGKSAASAASAAAEHASPTANGSAGGTGNAGAAHTDDSTRTSHASSNADGATAPANSVTHPNPGNDSVAFTMAEPATRKTS
jgi:hypothetical protein